MRSGLLVAGVAVAIVGAGLMVSLFFLPSPPTNTRYSSVSIAGLGPNDTRSWPISAGSSTAGTLSLSWSASSTVSVSLWKASVCGGATCVVSPALVAWNGNVSGSWTYDGSVGTLYLLSVTNFGHVATSFTGALTETYVVASPSQAVPAWALITIGGLFLLGIGGVAIFLGLFLEPGVYRPPEGGPGRPRSDDELRPDLGPDPNDFGEM